MEQVVNQVFAVMGGVPLPLVFLIAALWVGVESAGVGVPIEPMMLFVGSLAAQSSLNHVLLAAIAVLCVALGCLTFATWAYVIGRRVGTTAITRIGRFIGLNQTRADHIELWLRHRGAVGVLIARETPMVRTFGSYIMGAAEIPVKTFLPATFVGSLIYVGVWITLGSVLGANYQAPLRYLSNLGTADRPGIIIVAATIAVIAVLHHFWGRLTLHRIAIHFRRHHAALAAQAAAV